MIFHRSHTKSCRIKLVIGKAWQTQGSGGIHIVAYEEETKVLEVGKPISQE